MKIRNVIHKGLKRFIEHDDSKGLPAIHVEKLRRIIAFLQDMGHEDELLAFPHWGAHRLSGQRKGQWSLFVGRNWRLTFHIDNQQIEIIDLNFEDYH